MLFVSGSLFEMISYCFSCYIRLARFWFCDDAYVILASSYMLMHTHGQHIATILGSCNYCVLFHKSGWKRFFLCCKCRDDVSRWFVTVSDGLLYTLIFVCPDVPEMYGVFKHTTENKCFPRDLYDAIVEWVTPHVWTRSNFRSKGCRPTYA